MSAQEALDAYLQRSEESADLALQTMCASWATYFTLVFAGAPLAVFLTLAAVIVLGMLVFWLVWAKAGGRKFYRLLNARNKEYWEAVL